MQLCTSSWPCTLTFYRQSALESTRAPAVLLIVIGGGKSILLERSARMASSSRRMGAAADSACRSEVRLTPAAAAAAACRAKPTPLFPRIRSPCIISLCVPHYWLAGCCPGAAGQADGPADPEGPAAGGAVRRGRGLLVLPVHRDGGRRRVGPGGGRRVHRQVARHRRLRPAVPLLDLLPRCGRHRPASFPAAAWVISGRRPRLLRSKLLPWGSQG